MGCFWSSDASIEREEAYRRHQRNLQTRQSKPEPCFGAYRCQCGRYWESRLSWPNKRQACTRCKRQVYAHTQRSLRPSDFSEEKLTQEQDHKKECCEMCQQLGRSCGTYSDQSRMRRTSAKVCHYKKPNTGFRKY